MYFHRYLILLLLIFCFILLWQSLFRYRKGSKSVIEVPIEKTLTPTSTRSIPTSSSYNLRPKVTPTVEEDNTLLFDFRYPGSLVISNTANRVILESNESPEAITSWYESFINRKGMHTKTFIKTSTNGNVINKLVGSNGKETITVEVTKPVSPSTVTISIERA